MLAIAKHLETRQPIHIEMYFGILLKLSVMLNSPYFDASFFAAADDKMFISNTIASSTTAVAYA